MHVLFGLRINLNMFLQFCEFCFFYRSAPVLPCKNILVILLINQTVLLYLHEDNKIPEESEIFSWNLI